MATKEETREAILHAAQGLFNRFGPIKTSVADIARELGMSAANIYNFFPSRDAILETLGELHIRALKVRVENEMRREEKSWTKIEILFLRTALHLRDHLENEKDILQLQMIERQNEWKFVEDYYAFILEMIEAVLQRGLKSGEFKLKEATRRPLPVADAALALFDSMVSAYDPLLLRKFDRSDHERRIKAQLRLLECAFT